ncbi:MAG: hypothetical protein WCK58_04945, partial [Chloroflexota bacterium]
RGGAPHQPRDRDVRNDQAFRPSVDAPPTITREAFACEVRTMSRGGSVVRVTTWSGLVVSACTVEAPPRVTPDPGWSTEPAPPGPEARYLVGRPVHGKRLPALPR